MFQVIQLSESDNIAVSSINIPENALIENHKFKTITKIPQGHKISIKEIKKGEKIIKYGQIIGEATENIQEGEHVHSHNLAFVEFKRETPRQLIKKIDLTNNSIPKTFEGLVRKNGKIGTRNFIGLVSTVNCSATVVKQIADKINFFLKDNSFENIDGAVCLKHSSGCGMNTNGYGMQVFHRTIEGFKNHPNFSHVFVIGLGCECAQVSLFQNKESTNVTYLNIQDEGGTKSIIDKCFGLICDILPEANNIQRSTRPVEELSIALQCGGSDSYSGITANPSLGYASDLIVSNGGSTLLAETPEIYGAEHLLKGRTAEKNIQDKLDKHILWWQDYTKINGGSMDNNPSPGNKKGGITTILEKSLGAVAKGGKSKLVDVIDYAELIQHKGFNFMNSPGYDPVSVTGQVASGTNIICFTTGRGSCFGYKPVPSIKIATNSNMYNRMEEDMDINSGTIMEGLESIEENGIKIYNYIIKVASGKKTKSEENGYGDDEFNPWVIGATL